MSTKYDALFAAWGERETATQAELLDLAIATTLRLLGQASIVITTADVAETIRTHTIRRVTTVREVGQGGGEVSGWGVFIEPKE